MRPHSLELSAFAVLAMAFLCLSPSLTAIALEADSKAELVNAVVDGGGGASSGGVYSILQTIGGVNGVVNSSSYRASYGFAAQLRPISSAQLTVSCDPAAGGTTSPTPGTTVLYVGDTYEAVAYPAQGYSFSQWTGSGSIVISTPTSATTSFVISGGAAITAHFTSVTTLLVSVGSVVEVTAASVGLQQFTMVPKVYTSEDGSSQSSLSVVTAISSKAPVPSLLAERRKAMALYNKKDYTNKQIGKLLAETPMSNMRLGNLYVSSKQIGKAAYKIDEVLYFAAPSISSIPTTPVNPGDMFSVQGAYFGKTAPKVLVEYQAPNGRWKYATSKIDKNATYRYMDAKGTPQKSCQKILSTDTTDDKNVGYSQVTAAYPKLPSGAMPSSYIVIDNGSGMASFKLTAGE